MDMKFLETLRDKTELRNQKETFTDIGIHNSFTELEEKRLSGLAM